METVLTAGLSGPAQLFFIMLVLHIVVAFYVFAGARENGMNPTLWTALYLVTGPIGFLLFEIARGLGGALGGSGMHAPAQRRIREIDRRKYDNLVDQAAIVTPRPSEKFDDSILRDFIVHNQWPQAKKHCEDMKSMALNQGDKRLSEDYRRCEKFIISKRNPFKDADPFKPKTRPSVFKKKGR